MRLPLQITLRGMEPSAAMETRIRELAGRLDRFSAQIMRCQVIVEAPHRHRHQGALYEVHIHVTVPGSELTASREHRALHSHEDVYVALRDAFRAMRRQLEDYERERRQDVKHHEPQPVGWIAELSPLEDFGRIETDDGLRAPDDRHRGPLRRGERRARPAGIHGPRRRPSGTRELTPVPLACRAPTSHPC
jgi:ribosomal subunit interface protein